ncbi:MAG: undecaprenyl-diphosphate phosphatase [Actinobacteria bacterium]|nr:undecaprenyl-diphosphate phosphatase [Actinomycetota bacterium]
MGRVAVIVAAGAAFLAALALTVTGAGDRPDALPNWQALVLGLVQGATELLPVSSSGHLILVPWLGDWEYLKEHDAFNQTFDVSLHLGTLIAVVLYFARDIASLAAAFVRTLRRRKIDTDDERIAWFVAVATLPAALVGVVAEEVIAERLGEPWQIAALLGLFGGILWLADRRAQTRRMRDLSLRAAFALRLAQCLSLIPGVSRSGVTISAGRFLGLDRDSAARFSFLLLVPITFGAVLYKGVTDVLLSDLPPGMSGPFLVGSLASGASGLLAISALLGYVRRHNYSLFVWYRLVAGAVVLVLIATGLRTAGY